MTSSLCVCVLWCVGVQVRYEIIVGRGWMTSSLCVCVLWCVGVQVRYEITVR